MKTRAVIKRPDEKFGHMTNISCSLKNLQTIVGGYVEMVRIASGIVILCNEEGMIQNLPFNCNLCRHRFYGDLIFIGIDGEEFADIPISFKDFKRIFFGGES